MVGVVVSGTRDDGAVGLAVIKASGGVAVVQDPDDAIHGGMPTSAIAHVAVDAIVPSGQLASTIAAMVKGADPLPPASSGDGEPDPPEPESVVAVCPGCGGVLTREHGEIVRQALTRAAGTTLRRVSDDDAERPAHEEGAA